ncbi:HD-GYP domain-containing protein [Jutongia sp.]|uniref:HD-GYP domain-containing protein n=1 Tax=Jutongia sp. TaxID=2944204 RepID=UPI00307FD271
MEWKFLPEDKSGPARKSRDYRLFNERVIKSAQLLEKSLSEYIVREDEDLNTNKLLKETREIIALSDDPVHTFRMLRRVRRYDDLTYIHSLNVAILCHEFANWMHMPEEEQDILTLAGLLHDVGKMGIPGKIIKKAGLLTDEEYELIKQHPQKGYDFLKQHPLDERIMNAALMHHERCDGSGYPQGLKADEIDDFAKIVAIADYYDALTSARVYREPHCPFEVFRMLQQERDKFDSTYLAVFMEGVASFYIGCEVVLSNQKRARMVDTNPTDQSNPIVKMDGLIVNLAMAPDVDVKEIC